MSWFTRWMQSLILALGFGALTMSCQVLFGEFKVGAGGFGGASGASDPGVAGGSSSVAGGAGGGQLSAFITVVPTSDLFTSDLGGQAKFYVSLAQRPMAPVTMPITSSNPNQGTVIPASLSFTRDDWNAPQVVTVTGVHDPAIGNKLYSVQVGPAISEDALFQGAKAVVPITNIDNDSAGFFVTPTKGLLTTEAGGQAFFTVVLNLAPTADVDIALKSSDESIGTVAPSSLKFTADNWRSPQTVTVTGLNDEVAGGDRSFQIEVGPLTSGDKSFANLPKQLVSVTNQDNDQAGVMVTLATGIDVRDTTRLRTSESGDSATFTVVLNKEPTKPVTIALASSANEGTVNPATLTFTQLNWAAPQTVTVIGVDNDNVEDGDQPYQIKLGPVTSDDAAYGKLTNADLPAVNVVNDDNDKANLVVSLLSGVDPNNPSQLLTSEKGTKASFSMVLASKPKSPVQFAVNSTNQTEGSISLGEVDFTVDNWNTAQTVTITGLDDYAKDGNVVYAVRISAPTTDDLAYQKIGSTDVKVVNLDDDEAGITLPKLLTGIDGGTKLITSETGGSATFSISLLSKPKSDVKVPVTSSNSLEGKATPAQLTFTPANYATAQTVTVTGQDDPVAIADGNQAYTVTVGPSTSDDSNYVGLSQSVKVTNTDNDTAYIVPSVYQGTTTEKGGTFVFGVNLSTQPTAAVTLTFVSSNMNEGKVSPASLTYTTANWATPQNITVTGVDEKVADGDQSYTIAVKGTNTSDPNYSVAATTLSLVNKDDDVVGLAVTAAANLQTTEAGGKATFTVALTSQPMGNVSVAVTSSKPAEGTVAPATLAFTANNWATAQTVTVTGVDDSVMDANQTYTVSLKTASSSADAKYAQLAASTVSLVNKDDDVAGITVTSTTCTTEPGTSVTFTVVLKSQPLGPVSIALSSDVPTVGKVAPGSLSFTTMNWNTAQTVTVTGVDDGSMGTMTPYKIVTAAAVSALDANYNGLNAADVACTNATPPPPPPPDPQP